MAGLLYFSASDKTPLYNLKKIILEGNVFQKLLVSMYCKEIKHLLLRALIYP